MLRLHDSRRIIIANWLKNLTMFKQNYAVLSLCSHRTYLPIEHGFAICTCAEHHSTKSDRDQHDGGCRRLSCCWVNRALKTTTCNAFVYVGALLSFCNGCVLQLGLAID